MKNFLIKNGTPITILFFWVVCLVYFFVSKEIGIYLCGGGFVVFGITWFLIHRKDKH